MNPNLNNPNRAAFLSAEACHPTATVHELWWHTGFVRCTDCQFVMRAQTLTTLPEHRCTQRQARLRQQADHHRTAQGAPDDCS